MKKRILALCIFLFILAACQQAQTPHPTATRYQVSDTPTASAIPPTATHPPQVSATPSPAPIQLDLPAVPEKIPAHKLALDEFNAGTDMKRLNIYGTGELNDLAFSPDGKYLAAATGRGIFLYDSKTFEQTSFIDTNDAVSAIAFSPDDPSLAVAIDGKVSLWNALSGQKLSALDGEFTGIWTLAYGKGGHIAAVGSDCSGCGTPVQKMMIWDAKTGKQIYFEKDIWYGTSGLAFTADGKRLAYGGNGGLSLFDVETKKRIVPHSRVDTPLTFVFNNNESSIFVISQNDPNQTIDIASGQSSNFDVCSSNLVHSQTLGACFNGGKIVIFDLSDGSQLSEIEAPGTIENWGRSMAFNPNGQTLAYKFKDLLYILDVKTGQEMKALAFTTFANVKVDMALFNGQLTYVAAIPNQRGQVDVVNIENGTHLQIYSLPNTEIVDFAFRPDQKTVATLDKNNTLTLWDIQTQQILYQANFSDHFLPPFTFSPNGLDVFLTNAEEHILKSEKFSGKLSDEGQNHYAYGLADPYVHNNYHFNQAGHLVLMGGDGKHTKITDTVTKQSKIIDLVTEKNYLEVEAFSLNADDKLIAIGTTEDIYVSNMETLKQISVLTGHRGRGGDGFYGMIRSVLFSPQSDLLVSVGWDGTTRLWNVHAGQELRRLNVCCQAVFTPDGRYLVTAGSGVLRVWGIPALTP